MAGLQRRGLPTDRGSDPSAGFGGDENPLAGDTPPPHAPAIPTTQFGGDVANQDNPRDLAAGQQPDVHRPTTPQASPTSSQGGGALGTPPQSATPSPVASQPPQPFTPIMPPGGPGPSAGGLYGSMGGLTGGGLGVPSILNQGGNPHSSVDIQRLLQLLGVPGGQ